MQVSDLAESLSSRPVISSQIEFADEGMVFEVEEDKVRQVSLPSPKVSGQAKSLF